MKIDGIAVDLLFVSLNIDSVPDDIDVLDDKYLRDIDEPSVRLPWICVSIVRTTINTMCMYEQVRSINGVRVTERILQLIPNRDHFRTTLIAVKYWARVSCTYSAGYVAYLCLYVHVAWLFVCAV